MCLCAAGLGVLTVLAVLLLWHSFQFVSSLSCWNQRLVYCASFWDTSISEIHATQSTLLSGQPSVPDVIHEAHNNFDCKVCWVEIWTLTVVSLSMKMSSGARCITHDTRGIVWHDLVMSLAAERERSSAAFLFQLNWKNSSFHGTAINCWVPYTINNYVVKSVRPSSHPYSTDSDPPVTQFPIDKSGGAWPDMSTDPS